MDNFISFSDRPLALPYLDDLDVSTLYNLHFYVSVPEKSAQDAKPAGVQ